jgi:hypothetical protein
MSFSDDSSYNGDCDNSYVDSDVEEEAQLPPAAAAEARASSRSNVKKTQCRIPSDLAVIENHLATIRKALHGEDIDRSLSIRVVKAVFTLQKKYRLDVQKRGESLNPPPKPAIRNTICEMMGLSYSTYTSIIGEYLKRGRFYTSTRAGNPIAKPKKIAHTKKNIIILREFVRARRMRRERTTARQVIDFFVKEGLLEIPVDAQGKYCRKALESANRGVRRVIERLKYRRGRRQNLCPDPSLIIKRDQYLAAFMANRLAPKESRLREVYMDESYIHEHYNKNDEGIWDPNDEQDVMFKKDPTKGSRYCFAAAIQGPNWKVDNPTGEDLGGLVPNSVWAFCPTKKEHHFGDYHKVFNGINFIQWWTQQLLPNLKQPSLILLDNAAYHKVRHPDSPNLREMKKPDVIAYLRSKGVEVDANRSAIDLKSELKEWIQKNIPIEIVRLANRKRTPGTVHPAIPYRSTANRTFVGKSERECGPAVFD